MIFHIKTIQAYMIFSKIRVNFACMENHHLLETKTYSFVLIHEQNSMHAIWIIEKKNHNLYFIYCKEKEIFWINNSKIHQRYFRILFLAISKHPIAKMRMRKSLNEDGRKHNKNEEMSSVPFPFEFISAICSWKRTLRTWLLLNGKKPSSINHGIFHALTEASYYSSIFFFVVFLKKYFV